MERRRMMMAQKGEPALPIDLSMVDNAGNPRASMTTANCYLVHKKGTYMIPLVYGNAIKNGAVNTEAFNPTGTSGTTFLKPFINHAGTGITGPWITKSTSGTGVNKGMGLTAASAELLWQDRAGLITSVSVNGDYLEFTVGSFGGGNALIAVKNGSGTILWSWHIWATSDTLSNTTVVSTGSHNYTVASVNLGWVPTGGDGKQGYCPYYQWGRKDPFVPAESYNSSTNHTVYNISGSTVTGISYVSGSATIGTKIQNPTNFYSTSVSYYNAWDARNTAKDNVTSATKKTIYDPCPPGFCVPTGNLYCYMGNGLSKPTSDKYRSDSNWDSTNKGKTWTLNGASIYFPAAGNRKNSSGALNIVGSWCFCWSAQLSSSSSSSNLVRILRCNSNAWYWNSYSQDYGYTVRPVAEE